ncbi:hypothetical protein GW17_00014220 [Ensete ventricosum]|nr:hypothetical protein GW17_00014220 [Ensete ventricosum]
MGATLSIEPWVWPSVEQRFRWFLGPRSTRLVIVGTMLRVIDVIFGLAYPGCRVAKVIVHVAIELTRRGGSSTFLLDPNHAPSYSLLIVSDADASPASSSSSGTNVDASPPSSSSFVVDSYSSLICLLSSFSTNANASSPSFSVDVDALSLYLIFLLVIDV